MKLNVAVNDVILSNTGASGEFRIRNSAKAFSILSSGLYSNKIRAVIRELSCNALDSHVAAGQVDVPFEVHLPTMFEPWFAVKDFGTGLSGDQVMNIYTTYFESTKTESNEFIGALGLGSKSPFSYTENFTVTAIKDGDKRIYSAYINEMGVPSVTEMSHESTSESNGVEVKFSVVDRYDYQSFRNEASTVFKWFKNKPNIVGVDEFVHDVPKYKEENIVPGVHVMTNARDCLAIMGNICYPLNRIPEPEKHFGHLSKLLTCGLVLEFGIGELDFSASREELSYIPLTIASIKKKLEALSNNLASHVATKADAITSEWERAFYLYSHSAHVLYSTAVQTYATNAKFELYDPNSYVGKKTFKLLSNDLPKRRLTITAFKSRGGNTSRISESSEYISKHLTMYWGIPVEPDTVIIFNDLKTGCAARARFHYNQSGEYKTVFCISHNDSDLAVRQIEYDKLVRELHNPPNIIKASTLSKPVKSPTTSTQGIMTLELKKNERPGHPSSYTWRPYYDELSEDETYHFVYLSQHTPITKGDAFFDMCSLKALMDSCGVSSISNIKVFGVRKYRAKEISELDNWVWIEEKVKKEVATVSDSHVASLIASEMLDGHYNRVYTSANIVKHLNAKSFYAKYINEFASVKRATGNVTQLISLCSKYGNTVTVDAVKKKFIDAKAQLYSTYPMLKHINNNADEQDVANYINLIDKQEKI